MGRPEASQPSKSTAQDPANFSHVRIQVPTQFPLCPQKLEIWSLSKNFWISKNIVHWFNFLKHYARLCDGGGGEGRGAANWTLRYSCFLIYKVDV